ncbi:unnamed protein product [Closterium sp. Yama58-4]|nr:unnamed protein product [Closterium sp. Yama58-4]
MAEAQPHSKQHHHRSRFFQSASGKLTAFFQKLPKKLPKNIQLLPSPRGASAQAAAHDVRLTPPQPLLPVKPLATPGHALPPDAVPARTLAPAEASQQVQHSRISKPLEEAGRRGEGKAWQEWQGEGEEEDDERKGREEEERGGSVEQGQTERREQSAGSRESPCSVVTSSSRVTSSTTSSRVTSSTRSRDGSYGNSNACITEEKETTAAPLQCASQSAACAAAADDDAAPSSSTTAPTGADSLSTALPADSKSISAAAAAASAVAAAANSTTATGGILKGAHWGLSRAADHILGQAYEDLSERYAVEGRQVGSGQYGVIRRCVEEGTGRVWACKTIDKRKIKTSAQANDLRSEVATLQLLHGHPSVITLIDAVEDSHHVHLLMDLCSGGDLFDRISLGGPLSEQCAAGVCRQLAEALLHCHRRGVVHRDVKPENILLVGSRGGAKAGEKGAKAGAEGGGNGKSQDTKAPRIKLVDFGIARFFRDGEKMRDCLGTPEYMAPELLLGSYGPEVDVWSAGVVTYVSICGHPPFWASASMGQSLQEAILTRDVTFATPGWVGVSAGCKELIRRMLHKNPRKRITLLEVLVVLTSRDPCHLHHSLCA